MTADLLCCKIFSIMAEYNSLLSFTTSVLSQLSGISLILMYGGLQITLQSCGKVISLFKKSTFIHLTLFFPYNNPIVSLQIFRASGSLSYK